MKPSIVARTLGSGLLMAAGLLFGSQACGEAFQAGPEGGAGAAAGTATTSTGTSSIGGGGSAAGGGGSSIGGGGGSVGGGGSSTGVGGSLTGEDCYNDVDDDGDNLVDCADNECTDLGFRCRALGSWGEPVVLLDPLLEDSCPSGWELDVAWQAGTAIGPTGPSCLCSACDASGVQCNGTPGVTLYGAVACGGGTTQVAGTALGSCFPFTLSNGAVTLRARPINATGDCGPGSAQVAECEVTGPHQRCTRSPLVTGGCDGELVCVPPPAPLLPVCTYQVGDMECPAGLQTNSRTLLHVLHDTRQCTCGCQSSCDESATVYCDTGCTSSDKVEVTGADCGALPNCGASRSAEETATPQCETTTEMTGSCSDAEHLLTFCCWTS